MKKIQHLCLCLAFSVVGAVQAQPVSKNEQSFSLAQAIDYALKNSETAKNAQLDVLKANYRIKEVRAIGLPQINGSVQVTDNFKIRPVILPPESGAAFSPPGTPISKEPVVLKFGIRNTGDAILSASQLLFDGTFFTGLQAAKVYRQLVEKQAIQSEEQIIENVKKAYYAVLVYEEGISLLDKNLAQLDTLLRNTEALFKQGFVEEIEVMRLQVARNNLATQKENTLRGIQISRNLLQLQMGLELGTPLTLTDKLDKNILANIPQPNPENYKQRIEYSILETQLALTKLDAKVNKVGYLPSLRLVGNYGATAGRQNLGEIFYNEWFSLGSVGLALSIPIFDGGMKYHRMQQAKIDGLKVENGFSQLKRAIHFEQEQAYLQVQNNLSSLTSQQRNYELAQEVLRVAKKKYAAGVGSSLEVVQAETDMQTAFNNYQTALYNAIVSKIDLDKALGQLK
jgi:outer membrane protein TolC